MSKKVDWLVESCISEREEEVIEELNRQGYIYKEVKYLNFRLKETNKKKQLIKSRLDIRNCKRCDFFDKIINHHSFIFSPNSGMTKNTRL